MRTFLGVIAAIAARKVAEYSWPKYQAYFNGTSQAPAEIPLNAASLGQAR